MSKASLEEAKRRKILAQIDADSPISSSLSYRLAAIAGFVVSSIAVMAWKRK